MTDRFQGIPEIIYGTAFKFENSASLAEAALKAGFRAIDTAGSKSAYREGWCWEGHCGSAGHWTRAGLRRGSVSSRGLQIQTKFSPFKPDKDPALYPYDTTKSIPEQVVESVASSLANLGVEYLDSLVLHSLYPDIQDTLAAWRAMEALVPSKVTSLGLSNIDLESLRQVCEVATVKPNAVQNRFTVDTADKPNPKFPSNLPYPLVTWDRDVREYCRQHEFAYAPWGMLWGSLDVLDGPDHVIEKAGKEVGISKEIACYACMRSLSGCQISLLCGTSNEGRMHETLEGLAKVQRYIAESEEHKETWQGYVESLKAIVDGAETSR
ncbi:Aldo/keto reductase [Stipitochalara longipes BDJ]|nr:Aldo/keto reductase [Stipitochalara longipes BDJ]